jgi:hypothetical protein
MTQEEFYQVLKNTGLPVIHEEAQSYPTLPYIVYLFNSSNESYADNINYFSSDVFQVELYTKHRDKATELILENKLREASLTWSFKNGTRISEEKLFQVVYLIQAI